MVNVQMHGKIVASACIDSSPRPNGFGFCQVNEEGGSRLGGSEPNRGKKF